MACGIISPVESESNRPVGKSKDALPKNANMAQLVEHILGKDEVPGSNPGISLKRRHLEIGAIFIFSDCGVKYAVGV